MLRSDMSSSAGTRPMRERSRDADQWRGCRAGRRAEGGNGVRR